MPSQALIARKRSVEHLVQTAATSAVLIDERLNQALAPVLANEPVVVAPLVRALGRAVQQSYDEAAEAERAHEDELLDDPDPRHRRDFQASRATTAVIDLRDGVRGTYGVQAEAKLGVVGPTPRDPQAIWVTGSNVLPRIAEAVSGPAVRAGFSFDPTPARATLQEALPLLQVALADVAREKKEADQTLTTRQARLDAHDRTFSRVANLLTALLEAIGEYELAARVRPSARRPGLTQLEEEAEAAAPAPPPPA